MGEDSKDDNSKRFSSKYFIYDKLEYYAKTRRTKHFTLLGFKSLKFRGIY